IAPALVVYSWALAPLGKVGWLAAFIYAVAGALRLARFNTQLGKEDKRYFQGLAIPAAAGVIASMVWLAHSWDIASYFSSLLIAVITVITGVLMVSNIRYRSFKDIDLKGKVPFMAMLILVLIFVLISINPPEVLFVIFFAYGLSGPVVTLWRLKRRHEARKKE
ncbi:MAG TPA: CDP-diacylglycerol--serine O-phosphatidyltransferase, partial [Gammaproteobacteria bacterium]|nr:CDP-diacylglycerol--serine O-phosphatidyltransferase [Gammaproteobacteria bacterium]